MNLDMEDHFIGLFKRHRNSDEIDEKRAHTSDPEIFVVGFLNDKKNQILQYSTVSDSWTIIENIMDSSETHIHSIKQPMCIIILISKNLKGVEVQLS